MKFIRRNIKVISIIILVLIILSIIFLKNMLVKSASIEEKLIVEENLKSEEILEEKEVIESQESIIINEYVDIKGEVNNPGVYIIDSNMRIIDLIAKAGGLTENADTSLINLAKKVTDQMVIVIFNKENISSLKTKNDIVEESIIVDPEVSVKEETDTQNKENSDTNQEPLPIEGSVSLNNATKEELMQVPGIGEKKADTIIEYRTKEAFTKIEDLLNISGIGEVVYEKIKIYFKL